MVLWLVSIHYAAKALKFQPNKFLNNDLLAKMATMPKMLTLVPFMARQFKRQRIISAGIEND